VGRCADVHGIVFVSGVFGYLMLGMSVALWDQLHGESML
jgi:hypothetical protein